MENNFSFESASTEQKTSVLKPGLHEVTVESVIKGNVGDSEYLEIKVVDKTDSVLIQRFFLNTTIKEGSKVSAWQISSSALLQIIKATNNIESDEEAKAKMTGVKSSEDLATKLSYVIVGKPFRLKVNGKETEYQDKRFIKSLFGSYTFAESLKIALADTKLKPYTSFLPQGNVENHSTEKVTGDLGW